MFIRWFIGLIGYLFMGMIYCQDSASILAGLESTQDNGAQVPPSAVVDNPVGTSANNTPKQVENDVVVTSTIAPTTQIPVAFSCYQCQNCKTKSDFVSSVCGESIEMCYVTQKRINNTIQITHRGCSTSKDHCMVSKDDQSNSFDTVTCCKTHQCNQATQFLPWFFLSTLSLFIILINILHT